jgi:hypothetical protein
MGPCQELFGGVYGNIDIFFNMADCLGLAQPSDTSASNTTTVATATPSPFTNTAPTNGFQRTMAPTTWPIRQGVTTSLNYRRDRPTYGDWRDVHNTESFIVEGWGEGFMFGALLMMVIITIANMRRGILLHKVILLEVSDGLANVAPALLTS